MRNPNAEIVAQIKENTLALLMKKDPAEIGMRDIAAKCNITAANIYHYFKDKTSVFQAISRDSIAELNSLILKASENLSPREKILNAASVFRDWCLAHPRRAVLLFSKTESDIEASGEIFSDYYQANRTAASFLEECISEGIAYSDNPERDINVFISGLWGCIESSILKKSEPRYWSDCSELTQRFIDIWMSAVFK
ncbi:TetR/AcrR family transcriptional regulator [Treponema sp.]|uniref:TetR/AcrR family transcriptional regulator n=1 Tax=Treponema sp. TaxID=166 RepID=UPI003F10AE3D